MKSVDCKVVKECKGEVAECTVECGSVQSRV